VGAEARGLGRREPTDWEHVERYPLRAAVPELTGPVNRSLGLPWWHKTWDQGREGACVGFGCSMMMSVLNSRKYAPRWLWNEAKEVDEWPDTNPGDDNGTSVRAGCDVLRDQGHRRVYYGRTLPPSLAEGISENRWATSVDEVRACIAAGVPVAIGVNWYTAFDRPEQDGTRWWAVRRGQPLGRVRGGHCVCVYGASDRLQAVRFKNSWGPDYPLALLPYTVLQRLLDEGGEATVVTDRP
jgi:hypothetical protein